MKSIIKIDQDCARIEFIAPLGRWMELYTRKTDQESTQVKLFLETVLAQTCFDVAHIIVIVTCHVL